MFSFAFHFASTIASSLFPITSPVVKHWVSTYSASNFCRIIIVPNYISSCDMLGIDLLSFNSAMSLFNSRIIMVPNYISSCDTLDIDLLSFNSVISLFDAQAFRWWQSQLLHLSYQHRQPKNSIHGFRKPTSVLSLVGEIKKC